MPIEDDQHPPNISPIPTTSNQTVNEQPNASPATIPSIFSDIGFQPEVVQEEAAKNPTPTPSTSRATPKRPAGYEAPTTRCCTTPSKSNETNTDNDQTVNDFINIINNISPMPQLISNKDKPLRNKQHSEILTSTPMKEIFEEKKRKRIERENKTTKVKKNKGNCDKENCAKGKCSKGKCKKQNLTKNKVVKAAKKAKKYLFNSDGDDSSADQVDENAICDDESEYSEEETLCAICLDTGKSGEMWYRCRSCGNWAHKECSGSDSPDSYICAFCLDP